MPPVKLEQQVSSDKEPTKPESEGLVQEPGEEVTKALQAARQVNFRIKKTKMSVPALPPLQKSGEKVQAPNQPVPMSARIFTNPTLSAL